MLQREITSRKRIGLALGSGAARGLAHIGVLAALQKLGIRIDMISGTSMGALVGAVFAKGEDIDSMKELAVELGAKRFSFLVDPALPTTSLISGRKIDSMLTSIFGEVEFPELDVPFVCSATDIESGQEVILNQGLVKTGVKASCSIPVILAPTRYDGRFLVDGALVNPVPVSLLKRMGADIVIAVNVVSVESGNSQGDSTKKSKQKTPNILSIAFQTVNIVSSQKLLACQSEADIVINPQVSHIGRGDFHRVDELVLEGERAVLACEEELKRLVSS
jgi:NTE family protein